MRRAIAGGTQAARSAPPISAAAARALGEVVPGRAIHVREHGARRPQRLRQRAPRRSRSCRRRPRRSRRRWPSLSPSARGRGRRWSRRKPGSSRGRPARRAPPAARRARGGRRWRDPRGRLRASGGPRGRAGRARWRSPRCAPEDPRRWPTTPLVEVSGTSDARGPRAALKAANSATSLSGVPVPCALMKSDLVRIETGVREGPRQGQRGPRAFGMRRRHVARVAGGAGAAQLGQRRRPARPRVRERFQDEHARAFADRHARASLAERPAGRVVHRAQRVEPGVGDLAERVGRRRRARGPPRPRGWRPAPLPGRGAPEAQAEDRVMHGAGDAAGPGPPRRPGR